MHHRSTPARLRGAIVVAGLLAVPALAAAQTGDVVDGPTADVDAAVRSLLGLRDHQIATVDLSGAVAGGSFSVTVPVDGADLTLDVTPYTALRGDGYQLRAQLGDGSIVTYEPGLNRAFRGVVAGLPESRVAGSLLEDGLYATMIMPDGKRWWVEAVGRRLGLDESMHVVYDDEDILPHGGSCGSQAERAPVGDRDPAIGNPVAIPTGASTLCVAEVAADADVEYFNDYGSVVATRDRIELVVGTGNLQYESEVGITHQFTNILVRTQEPDPYSEITNTNLLCQFINEWSINQLAIQRDVAQLFTGKEISGSVIGQAAELGSICNANGCTNFPCDCGQFGTSGSYCFVQSDFNGNFACATDLSAHEFGHLWDGVHCSCPSNTMNPSITCANTFSATLTRPDIIAYRDSLPCLDCLAPVEFNFPNGRPSLVSPDGGTTVRVEVSPGLFTPSPGTGRIFVDTGGGFVSINMTEVSPNVYDATFPASTCPTTIAYYFQVNTSDGGPVTEPAGAPGTSFSTVSGFGTTVVIDDDFETNMGWTVQNSGGLTDGAWERGVPAGGGDRGDPANDADGSGQCYVTDNADGNSDVDGGSTTLLSPTLDASQGDSILTYFRWFDNTAGSNPESEVFVVDVSSNNGGSWTNLETVGPAGPEVAGGWFEKQFDLGEFITLTDQVRVRFIAADPEPGSVVEAGVDGVRLVSVDCTGGPACTGDVDGDDTVGFSDVLAVLSAWGPCPACPEDTDGDNVVGFSDLLTVLNNWGPCS